MGNLKRRVERLEGGRKGGGAAIIIVKPGETTEEAWQKHLAQHPEAGNAEMKIFIKRCANEPDASI